ncbi:MAG TPA: DUF6116 family protein [Methylomirabilota bacterium]|jgi:hypothetical protein|nr:DUF6116 family protein [Methylomirabilota bacterium]
MGFGGSAARGGFIAGLLRRLNLRFPTLFALLALLTLLDLVLPDPLPLVDELGLALLTLLLGLWRDRRTPRTTATRTRP